MGRIESLRANDAHRYLTSRKAKVHLVYATINNCNITRLGEGRPWWLERVKCS